MTSYQKPSVQWSLGTAYDLFASLHVLHHPQRFGLRLSWAAGVRSRLTPFQRSTLEESQNLFFNSPIAWVSSLPEPRDAETVLRALSQIKPAERLTTLAYHVDVLPKLLEMLGTVKTRGSWNQGDLDQLQKYYPLKEYPPSAEELVTALNWWSRAGEFGERYLDAMQAYISVFFADEVVFAPSYWSTPLVMYDSAVLKHWVVLFGARPAAVALVPGELVPDAMLRVLKALSDPTRLLILRYLSDQPLTPSQLAKKLRLRAPTVTHHLSALRLAGLVYVSLDQAEEKRYTVRESVIADTYKSIHKFLTIKGEE
jgi:DNA-binding transcriptional ArsR family regulator